MARIKRSAARKKKSRIRRKIESLFEGSGVSRVPADERSLGSTRDVEGRTRQEIARRIVDDRAINNVPEHADQFEGTNNADAPLDVVIG